MGYSASASYLLSFISLKILLKMSISPSCILLLSLIRFLMQQPSEGYAE
jgi:hypothetical protein